MAEASATITAEQLRALLAYEPETGDFRWLVRRRGAKAGISGVAGGWANGYRIVRIDGRAYYSHRLAWLWMTGEWPAELIDHANMDTADNCWSNLRAASHPQNHANGGKHKNNTSGFKGVSWFRARGRWAASITKNRQSIHLGYFDTPEEAHRAYVVAAERLNGEFARAA